MIGGMSNAKQNHPIIQLIITAVGGLIGAAIALHFAPASLGFYMAMVVMSASVLAGAVFFSWASKR